MSVCLLFWGGVIGSELERDEWVERDECMPAILGWCDRE